MTENQADRSTGPWWSKPFSKVIDFAAGQPFNNLLTAGLLISIGVGIYYGGPALLLEVRQQRSDFTSELKTQRSEFLQCISQADERCSKAIEREHTHARELFDRAFGKRVGAPMPDLPATAKGGGS